MEEFYSEAYLIYGESGDYTLNEVIEIARIEGVDMELLNERLLSRVIHAIIEKQREDWERRNDHRRIN